MTEDPQPKIVIDQDWKERAAAEKEALAREFVAKKAAEATSSPTAAASGKSAEQPPLPPASFAVLVGTLGTQALALLGQIPHPESGKVEIDLPYARHFIDTLQVLEEKTRGNLTPDESRVLSELLHELRLAYVAARDRPQATA
jgi:hypothetical protein